MTKIHLRTGDLVEVISGNHKGKRGPILRMDRQKYRAFVEGVNLQTHYIKPSEKQPKGAVEKKEGPLHLSNLMLVESDTDRPTRVGRRLNEQGKLQRFSKKTGKFL